MATDQFSTLQFLLKGDQTETDNTIPIGVWLSTLFNSSALLEDESVKVHFAFFMSTCIALFLTLAIGIVQFLHVYKYISVIRLKNNMYYLIFLNPISCLCCFFGMASPRNAAFMYGVILSYHMLAIRIALDVMFNINGGRVTLSKMLTLNNERIRFTFFPFCLFHKCLPSFAPTVNNIARFEMVVSQTCIVRVVLTVIDICVYREIGTLNHFWFFISHAVSVVSTMIALYFSYAISGVNRENSKKFRFQYLFMMIDWSQTLITFQKTLFDLLSYFRLYPRRIFPRELIALHFAQSVYILFFLYSLEVLIMSILISYLLRPSKSYIFDKYTGTRAAAPPTYMYLDDSDEGLLPAVMESDSAQPPSNPSQVALPGTDNQASSMDQVSQVSQQQPAAAQSQPKGEESQIKDPKEGVSVQANPATLQKLAEVTTPEDKKIPVEGGVPDDGAYENLKSQSMKSMNKLLQDEVAADDFFKVPTESQKDATGQNSS